MITHEKEPISAAIYASKKLPTRGTRKNGVNIVHYLPLKTIRENENKICTQT